MERDIHQECLQEIEYTAEIVSLNPEKNYLTEQMMCKNENLREAYDYQDFEKSSRKLLVLSGNATAQKYQRYGDLNKEMKRRSRHMKNKKLDNENTRILVNFEKTEDGLNLEESDEISDFLRYSEGSYEQNQDQKGITQSNSINKTAEIARLHTDILSRYEKDQTNIASINHQDQKTRRPKETGNIAQDPMIMNPPLEEFQDNDTCHSTQNKLSEYQENPKRYKIDKKIPTEPKIDSNLQLCNERPENFPSSELLLAANIDIEESKVTNLPSTLNYGTTNFVTTSNFDDTNMSSIALTTENVALTTTAIHSSLLKKYEKIKETANNFKLENATLQIEKGLVESSWDFFITQLGNLDSMEALEEFKKRHYIL